MTLEISVTEARAQFSELLNRVGYGGEEVVITRHGKPLVVLTPAGQARTAGTGGQVLDLSSRPGTHETSLGIAARSTDDPMGR